MLRQRLSRVETVDTVRFVPTKPAIDRTAGDTEFLRELDDSPAFKARSLRLPALVRLAGLIASPGLLRGTITLLRDRRSMI